MNSLALMQIEKFFSLNNALGLTFGNFVLITGYVTQLTQIKALNSVTLIEHTISARYLCNGLRG